MKFEGLTVELLRRKFRGGALGGAEADADVARGGDADRQARERHQLRFDAALRDWDRHVDRCVECFSSGVHLCAEGEVSAYWVEDAREGLARFELKQAVVLAAVVDSPRALRRGSAPARPA